jgi:hypothetical protein
MRDFIKGILEWVDGCPAWLNLIITSGFHGVLTALAGLVGFAGYMAFGYVVFKEGGPALIRFLRRQPQPRGWALADTITDAMIPVLVWLVFFT